MVGFIIAGNSVQDAFEFMSMVKVMQVGLLGWMKTMELHLSVNMISPVAVFRTCRIASHP